MIKLGGLVSGTGMAPQNSKAEKGGVSPAGSSTKLSEIMSESKVERVLKAVREGRGWITDDYVLNNPHVSLSDGEKASVLMKLAKEGRLMDADLMDGREVRLEDFSDSQKMTVKDVVKKYHELVKGTTDTIDESVNEADDEKYVVVAYHQKGGGFVMTKPISEKEAKNYIKQFPNAGSDITKQKAVKVSDARKIKNLVGKEYLNESILTEGEVPLYQLARKIRQDWKNVSPYAKPYLHAMETLDSVNDRYILDSGREIVARFLANAGSWRGPVAKNIKAILKKMIK